MVLLKIGYLDVTPYLDVQNYTMDAKPVYETWTDGNYVVHRDVVRTRHDGKAALGFANVTDFNAIQNLLTSQLRSGSYYVVQAYCTQTNNTVTFNAYVDITSSAKWDMVNNREWHVLNLTIMER